MTYKWQKARLLDTPKHPFNLKKGDEIWVKVEKPRIIPCGDIYGNKIYDELCYQTNLKCKNSVYKKKTITVIVTKVELLPEFAEKVKYQYYDL